MALVGEQGPELINFRNPGQVYNASQTGDILSGSETRLAALERSNTAMVNALNKIVENTKKTSDTLRNVSKDGDSFTVESEGFLEL